MLRATGRETGEEKPSCELGEKEEEALVENGAGRAVGRATELGSASQTIKLVAKRENLVSC